MPVHARIDDHTGIITLERPAARNAFDAELTRAFVEAVDAFEDDPDVRVVVLTGVDGFSAGGDLRVLAHGAAATISTTEGGFAGFVYRERSKPYIAAIEGFAFGGGCEIALACDIVVTAADARIALPEVKRGLVAGAGGLARLAASVGTARALLMLLTGEPISGRQAYDFGLAAVLTESGEALETAYEIAARVAANSPSAVRLSREVVRYATGVERQDVLRLQDLATRSSWSSDDGREGVAAFLEKREPSWSRAATVPLSSRDA